jgi:hypothetical protein
MLFLRGDPSISGLSRNRSPASERHDLAAVLANFASIPSRRSMIFYSRELHV